MLNIIFIIIGTKKIHTPIIILVNNDLLAFDTALSSFDITALLKSIVPKTIIKDIPEVISNETDKKIEKESKLSKKEKLDLIDTNFIL